ncbi:MAG: DNA-binding response OmpR family regulator [Candidatus Krumholzibacteriia bacterium]|jgi:DNA-binding response OmpR family regulator
MSKILLVDDDPQVRKMLCMVLQREGYAVYEAGDGEAAIAVYKNEDIDLVITDIVMPEKEGIGLIMELRNHDAKARIIAISGGGRMDAGTYLKWAERLGVDATFTKPVDRRELLDSVVGLLASKAVSC